MSSKEASDFSSIGLDQIVEEGRFIASFARRPLLYDANDLVLVKSVAASIEHFLAPLMSLCGGATIYRSDYPSSTLDEPDVRAFHAVAIRKKGSVFIPAADLDVALGMARFWFGGFAPAPGSFVHRGLPLLTCKDPDVKTVSKLLCCFPYIAPVGGTSLFGRPTQLARQFVGTNRRGIAVILNALRDAVFFVGEDLWCDDLLIAIRRGSQTTPRQ